MTMGFGMTMGLGMARWNHMAMGYGMAGDGPLSGHK
jgi:hypothetical protein